MIYDVAIIWQFPTDTGSSSDSEKVQQEEKIILALLFDYLFLKMYDRHPS